MYYSLISEIDQFNIWEQCQMPKTKVGEIGDETRQEMWENALFPAIEDASPCPYMSW